MHDVPERHRVIFGLAGAIVVAGLLAVSLAIGRGYYDQGYEVTAVFPTSSQGLFTDGGSVVKLRGINVGQVKGIELLPDGRARVTLFLRDDVRVADTAMASIEPLSVFGPKFVRLEPGANETTGPFLRDGGTIARTQTQRELTDILASATVLFEHLDPRDLVVTIDAIAEGVAGLGPEIGRTLDASGVLADVAARHVDDIRLFLTDAAALSGTFADHADDILVTARNTDDLLRLLTDDPDRLDQLLAATTDISTTFATLLRDNGDSLDVALRSVGSFIAGVDAESDQIPEFLDMIGTFFGRLSDVIRMEGPAGTRMAALRGFIALDACLVYGVCVGSAATTATAPTPAQAAVTDARALRALEDAEPVAGPLAELVDLLLGPAP
jgi:phospholipid/cholesterol/gamma-HCH transport system substrate-binding protein